MLNTSCLNNRLRFRSKLLPLVTKKRKLKSCCLLLPKRTENPGDFSCFRCRLEENNDTAVSLGHVYTRRHWLKSEMFLHYVYKSSALSFLSTIQNVQGFTQNKTIKLCSKSARPVVGSKNFAAGKLWGVNVQKQFDLRWRSCTVAIGFIWLVYVFMDRNTTGMCKWSRDVAVSSCEFRLVCRF